MTTRHHVLAKSGHKEQAADVLVSDATEFGKQLANLATGGCTVSIEPIAKATKTTQNGDPIVWITEHDMADVFCWLL